jgi:hypothetical protein
MMFFITRFLKPRTRKPVPSPHVTVEELQRLLTDPSPDVMLEIRLTRHLSVPCGPCWRTVRSLGDSVPPSVTASSVRPSSEAPSSEGRAATRPVARALLRRWGLVTDVVKLDPEHGRRVFLAHREPRVFALLVLSEARLVAAEDASRAREIIEIVLESIAPFDGK